MADARLAALLAVWPASIPLVMEFQDPSWHVDETFSAMRAAGAVLCTTDLPPEGDEGARGTNASAAATGIDAGTAPSPGADADAAAPFIRRTGSSLYLRLRRHDYDAAALDAWAARVEPFLAAGDDVYVFFRHDPVGRAPELASELRARL